MPFLTCNCPTKAKYRRGRDSKENDVIDANKNYLHDCTAFTSDASGKFIFTSTYLESYLDIWQCYATVASTVQNSDEGLDCLAHFFLVFNLFFVERAMASPEAGAIASTGPSCDLRTKRTIRSTSGFLRRKSRSNNSTENTCLKQE